MLHTTLDPVFVLLDSMGLMALPLLLCSVLTLTLILERFLVFCMLPSASRRSINKQLHQLQEARDGNCLQELGTQLRCCRGTGPGLCGLLRHAHQPKGLREEVAGLWLLAQKRRLNAGLRLLMVLGVLTPMLGLLGTVLGMIEMFQEVAKVAGPVTPAVLAAGLQTAMLTTAFGLCSAIPALAATHLFSLWANHYLSRLEFAMNHANLLLEGVQSHQELPAAVANPPRTFMPQPAMGAAA